jgi:hypothetical protein
MIGASDLREKVRKGALAPVGPGKVRMGPKRGEMGRVSGSQAVK